MNIQLKVYNTLTRKKEDFSPLHPPRVGMYVCGPTVYGSAHLGHARSAVNFDVIFRYLKHLGYQVRYVRNITDVGHLEGDADEGVDKIARQARLEALEPMEVVQRYTNSYRRDMALLRVQSPSIEPTASGHIPEQIAMIQQLIAAGFAYEVNGSAYFDVAAYHAKYHYGTLSGRVLEELLIGTRFLQGKQEKRSPLDFALWKKAPRHHLMRWSSPWGIGFPGWHTECAAIATKYLGSQFDIHGGGIDLLFPHHECELAHARAIHNQPLATYWLHNNLITINGQKMGKSLGNFITLTQLFQGQHPLLDQAYSPMALRYCILQAHYRSPLDFSTEALKAAHQGYIKLINGLRILHVSPYPKAQDEAIDHTLVQQVAQLVHRCHEAMCDDFNTPRALSALFGMLKLIHTLHDAQRSWAALGPDTFAQLKRTYVTFLSDLLGLYEAQFVPPTALLNILLAVYQRAKAAQQYEQVDAIRVQLKRLGIAVLDTPTGVQWRYA
jgi:cysteinyl-tRNA synthetase